MTAAAQQLLNPLASPEQIQLTPSRQDGISAELERDLRAVGALLIQQAGIQLKAPQVVMTTAAIMFQRYWYVSSLRNYSVKDIAAAALFLASKLEEHPIRIRDLINVFDYLLQRIRWEDKQATADCQDGQTSMSSTSTHFFRYKCIDYFAKEFYNFKDDIVIGESQMLKRLGFNTTCQNPYGSIVNYLQVLGLTDHPQVPQLAWSFSNDILLTPLLVAYPAQFISVACVYLACSVCNPRVSLPMVPAPWFVLFDVDTEEELWAVCRQLLDLYQRFTDSKDLSWLQEDRSAVDGSGTRDLTQGATLQSMPSIWRTVARLHLPLTKDDVRNLLDKDR